MQPRSRRRSQWAINSLEPSECCLHRKNGGEDHARPLGRKPPHRAHYAPFRSWPPCYAEEVNEEVREQLKAAVEECQSALRNRAEESD
jgi:hypothetical protein